MASSSSSTRRPKTVGASRYSVQELLGEGCFGAVHKGKDVITGRIVAIKFEDQDCGAPGSLSQEQKLLSCICQPSCPQGFVEVFYFGREGSSICMVMDYLGKSLLDIVDDSGQGRLDVPSTVLVAEQAIKRLEYLHSKGVVHRDIKPENFMWGVGDKIHHLYLIDFGLSARYFERKHVTMKSNNSMIGTARYASIGVHKGHTQSRRDDLEALGNMMFFLLLGALPWSGLKASSDEEKYKKIGEKKESTPVADLCRGFPPAFEHYLMYCRGLPYAERPDYERIRQLFRKAREDIGPLKDQQFSWLSPEIQQGPLTPFDPWPGCLMPDDRVGPPEKSYGLSCLFWRRDTAERPGRATKPAVGKTKSIDAQGSGNQQKDTE